MYRDPFTIILMTAAGLWVGWTWFQDTRRARNGETPTPGSFPGAAPAPARICLLGMAGALVLVALETGGELALGLAGEQTDITALFLLAMIAAGVVEELIFRGYLIRLGHGPLQLWASILGFSLLFTLLHPYFWAFSTPEGVPAWQFWKGDLAFTFTPKALFTSAFLFLNSLWYYWMRIHPWNAGRSLLPCFAAHVTGNVAVFAVKLAQGHVVAWY